MSLLIGTKVQYIVAPGKPPGLRIGLFLNGEEVLIKFIEWFEMIQKGFVRADFRLGGTFGTKMKKKISMQQEETSAADLGGHRQTGSGSRIGYKGDGRVFGRFRIENKFSTGKEFRLKLADLRKIRAECAALEVPVYDVQFRDAGTLKVIDHWALVPWSEWKKRANVQADDD